MPLRHRIRRDCHASQVAVHAASGDTRQPRDTRVTPDSDPDAIPTGSFRFVRIDDLSRPTGTPDGGADIDAVMVQKPSGTVAFAQTVENFRHGGGGPSPEGDPTRALGAPDSFYAYPDTTVCEVSSRGFVSLGGTGGLLVVGMALSIETGDTVSVLEVGGCDFGAGTAISEPVDVSISTGPRIDGSWIFLGTGQGPEALVEVPQLP